MRTHLLPAVATIGRLVPDLSARRMVRAPVANGRLNIVTVATKAKMKFAPIPLACGRTQKECDRSVHPQIIALVSVGSRIFESASRLDVASPTGPAGGIEIARGPEPSRRVRWPRHAGPIFTRDHELFGVGATVRRDPSRVLGFGHPPLDVFAAAQAL